MKKRLLSLVLCLVMVFSLFPVFDLSANAVVVDDVYESIDDVTNWTPNSDYAGYAAQSEDGKLYYKDEDDVLHPVDYSTTDTLWHADTRTNWTAATAATAGAATNATNSQLYYQKTDNLNSKVVVSKTNYFTKQSANNVDCTTNAVEKPSFVNYRQTDLYVYVPHDASSADNGEGCWHRVYYAECGADGVFKSPAGGSYGYFYTFFYFTNVQEGSTNAAESNGFYNENNANAKRGDTFGSGDTQVTLLSDFEECGVYTYVFGYATKSGYEGKWTNRTGNGTDGNLYKKASGNSSSYNKITTGAGATITCPIPNGNSSSTSHTYSGTFYTRVPLKVSVLKEADTNVPFSQAVSEDTDTLYSGTLYIKLPDEVTDPNPGEGGEGGILNPGGVDDAGFKLQKELSQNNEGTYDIKMQSYSTANTIQESRLEKVPTDFVVIVDQSGSMDTKDMATGYTEAGTKTLEECANGDYYYKDGNNYYRVYGKRDYLMEYHASETKWTQNIIEDAGMSLSWFQGEKDATFSQANQYYYKTTDGVYRPVNMSATGKLGTYYVMLNYKNASGTTVNFIRPVKPVYKNVFGSDTSKYGPNSFGYGPVNAAVLAAYPTTTAYTYSEFLGVTTGMYINYPMYTRHLGYSQLAYRDVNGIEHIVKTSAGGTTAEYCDSSANALTAATGGTRMNYSGLYQATGYKTRLAALKEALTAFVQAVANESDTKQGEDTTCAVDNRIAIVGFSHENYYTTEIITGNNVTKSSATTADYKAALISANNGNVGTVNPALTTAIASIKADGGTQPELGFQMAKSVLDNRENTTYDLVTDEGVTKERNKIVIFFTDGQPGDYDHSDQYSEANDVVASALPLKTGGAKVFSIGVFGESDGNPLTYDAENDWTYNASGEKVRVSTLSNKNCEYLGGFMGFCKHGDCLRRQWRPAGADAADNYTAVANDTIYDYMSVTSSNYPNAENYIAPAWLSGDYTGANGYTGATDGVRHKETATTSNRFYRMASNQETLVAAFEQSVSYASTLQQTTGAVMLDTTTVFRDAINIEDFDISNATYSVTWQPIYVNKALVATTGSAIGDLENDPDYPVVTPVVNQPVPADGVIEYSGFDYGSNYVSWGHTKGYKLIVTVHGIVPTTYNETIASNVDPDPEHQIYGCGIYEAGHDEPTYSVKSPTLRIDYHEPATTDVVMNKTLSDPSPVDGSYTITLDAYAKGNSNQSETTETTGADIVVVFDNSDTMKTQDMGGMTRFEKAAADIATFVDDLQQSGADHKIALVKGGHGSSTNQPYVYVGTEKTALSSATDAAFMSVADKDTIVASLNAMKNDNSSVYMDETVNGVVSNLLSANDGNKKIIIFMSDGHPNHYDTSATATAVANLKNAATVFSVQINSSDNDNNQRKFMQSVSSSYPNAQLSGSNWVPGTKEEGADYFQYINPTTTSSFKDVFDEVEEVIDYNVNLDKDAYLLDIINLDNLAVRSDLSEPVVKVYTLKGTDDGNGNVTFEPDTNKVDITNSVQVTFPSVTDEATGKTNLGVKVTGFDYSANFIGAPKLPNSKEGTAANQGKKIIVVISGLVPVHPGENQTSNTRAGVYDKEDDPAKEVPSPTFSITSDTSKTYVIDFSAPMTIATDAKSVAKMSGKNGDFTLVGSDVVYQITKSVGGKNLILEGVDQAFAFGKPVGMSLDNPVWSVLTTIPAGSVYFDDDFTATTTIVDGEPVTTFKEPINVGDGSGYNASVSVSPATENEPAGQQTFTFYGTGIDIYCTTDSTGGYVQAKLTTKAGAPVNGQPNQTIRNYTIETERYNVPSVSFTGLTAGEYTVTLNVLNSSNYKLDGIRVYNPVSNETYEGQEAEAKQEQYAAYINMREALVNNTGVSQAFTDSMDDAVLGALFVDDRSKLKEEKIATTWDSEANNGEGAFVPVLDKDGKEKTVTVYDSDFDAYKANSPKHEIYLSKNQAIIFQLSADAETAAANGNLWIGLSAPDAGKNTGTITLKEGKTIDVTSAVDMYYPITSDMIGANRVVTLTNTGDNMISVTNLKITGNQAIYNAANAAKANTSSVDSAKAATLSVEDVIPMVFEPMTMRSVKIAANNGVDPDAVVEPEVTPDPTPAPTETPAPVVTPTPTQAPSVHDIVKQIVSSFVSNLFRSISRLFGN